MTNRLMALLGALMATVSPLAAACPDGTLPDPAKVASAIDRYAEAPFSARTWRVLKGLGDPMIDMSYAGAGRWDDERRFKELAAQVSARMLHCRTTSPMNAASAIRCRSSKSASPCWVPGMTM